MKREIFSIESYADVADLFAEHDLEMTEDQQHFFHHVNDFEATVFYVINRDTVVIADGINGEVSSEETLDSFYASSIRYYSESDL